MIAIAPGLLRRVANAFLGAWFVAISTTLLVGPGLRGAAIQFGWDAVVYVRAARELLAGGDPWRTGAFGIGYAAPPPSLVPFLPFTWLPDDAVALAWVAIGALSAVYAVRRLALPWWWLLFPPIVLGVAAGSSAPLMLALLVRGGVIGQAAGVVTRVYAAVPLVLLGRWRSLAVAGVATAAMLPFLAVPTFVDGWPRISSVLSAQSEGGLSASIAPVLLAVAAVSLAALGRRRAAWLLVPALWPDTQLYYASIALPVVAEVPLAAAALASPFTPGLIAAGLAAQVAWEQAAMLLGRRRSSRALAPRTGLSPRARVLAPDAVAARLEREGPQGAAANPASATRG